mmetsp:Transcript_63854/g.118708  ORF Transcript_63854/g.118708 Transcript_63854/m.118708 type:complete len:221 (-) Transcript_63854:112-774(-)
MSTKRTTHQPHGMRHRTTRRSCMKKKQQGTDQIRGKVLSDKAVAVALSNLMMLDVVTVDGLMRVWHKPILRAQIPGSFGRVPSKVMLDRAKTSVIRFLSAEEARGPDSHVVQAFYLATGEPELRFEWEWAKRRVQQARLDRRRAVDSWADCLAMCSGEKNSVSEIYVCGTRRITLRALTSLICHEGLHNLARRTRRGNPFLSEEVEHVAMALIGDPQLAS